MIDLTITSDVEVAPWTELPRDVLHGVVTHVGLLRHGTSGGRASVGLAIRLDNGEVVVAETTLRLARGAAMALRHSPVYAEEDFD